MISISLGAVILSFYLGWRHGRNRAMAQLIAVAEAVIIEGRNFLDDRPEMVAGMAIVNRSYLDVIGKL